MADISAAPFRARWYHRIPLLGLFARDLDHDFEGNIWYFLTMVLSLVVIATMTWGLPALGLIALGCVPLMFVILFIITRG